MLYGVRQGHGAVPLMLHTHCRTGTNFCLNKREEKRNERKWSNNALRALVFNPSEGSLGEAVQCLGTTLSTLSGEALPRNNPGKLKLMQAPYWSLLCW